MEDPTSTNVLVFYVNGKKILDGNIDPEWTLLQYLRNKLRLCGTKLGCGEGGCGACTVMVSKFIRELNKVVHFPVNACLAPVCSMHGLAVTTVEGIGSTKTKLHPVQERIAKAHGSQCGFCTPGIVMSMYTLLRNNSKPKMDELEKTFQGNLCRCTGYRPILEAYKTFTEEWEQIQCQNSLSNGNGICAMGDKCCKNASKPKETEENLFEVNTFTPYHPSQEPIFPPELKLTDQYDKEYLLVKGETVTWHRPTTLHTLLKLKNSHPEAKIVVGNTEVGVETKFKNMLYPILLQPTQIVELNNIKETSNGIEIGAAVSLDSIEAYLKDYVKKNEETKVRIYKEILAMLNRFAGKQIRSVGTLGGNIMTSSPISDMIPILLASKSRLVLQSAKNGTRKIVLDEKFFTGYRKNIVEPTEILRSIEIPFSEPLQYFCAFKQSRRWDDDIAIVNAVFNIKFQPNSDVVADASFAFGGMSFKTVNAPKTEQNLKGKHWNRDTLELAYASLLEDLPLESGAVGGMVEYRRSLTLSLFFKAFLFISKELGKILQNIEVDEREFSAIDDHYRHSGIESSQYFNVIPENQQKTNNVQRPIVHNSAFKQASGEAVYCDDIPKQDGELYCSFVLSTKSYAKILSIDASETLQMKGVHGVITESELTDGVNNAWGVRDQDERIFYSDTVTSKGQIIAVVVADSQHLAQKAAKRVKVIYEELSPVILTIEDAIEHQSFYKNDLACFKRGDVDQVFQTASNVIEGECRMGGQEHFYMETQACLVIPKQEDGEMEVHSSTQAPDPVQQILSRVMGVPQNKITVKVRRIGGGFGGKETKPHYLVLPLAIAARKFNRPMRCMLDRHEDMIMTGGRHPFLFKYKLAFNQDGQMLGSKVEMYINAGCTSDLSLWVTLKALLYFNNAYNIPAFDIKGFTCKTNLPSNTAFRGFGAPQGMFLAETFVERIAEHLKIDRSMVIEKNLLKDGDLVVCGQVITECTLDKCWKECLETSHYYERRGEIREFNSKNRYKKRGISIVPTKFDLGFDAEFMNQAGALVLVYTDGSVLLSHGGVEMGQGLPTKMIQIASTVLDVPIERIHTTEFSTDKVPNATPTVGSFSADLNGMAVLNACETIKNRLEPYRKANPKGSWNDWVKAAYLDRVSLAATGFHKTPDIGYNWETRQGRMFDYFTYGVACSEVEIDTLTGDHQVLATDIVMDLGQSLNPAIDIGQIEGGFMQGYGLYIMEEMIYSPEGDILTRGPGTYKIPCFSDVPKKFNVSLLKGVSNPRAVFSSKAVGEPPLFLGSSVLFAIKDAIKAARLENNALDGYLRLDPPVTAAKIRMACQDSITSKIPVPNTVLKKPWNIEV